MSHLAICPARPDYKGMLKYRSIVWDYKFLMYICTLKYCGVEQLVARWAHNPKVVSSSLTPATKESLDQRSGLLYWCRYESKLVEIITIKAALKVTLKISTANFPFILSSKNRKIWFTKTDWDPWLAKLGSRHAIVFWRQILIFQFCLPKESSKHVMFDPHEKF